MKRVLFLLVLFACPAFGQTLTSCLSTNAGGVAGRVHVKLITTIRPPATNSINSHAEEFHLTATSWAACGSASPNANSPDSSYGYSPWNAQPFGWTNELVVTASPGGYVWACGVSTYYGGSKSAWQWMTIQSRTDGEIWVTITADENSSGAVSWSGHDTTFVPQGCTAGCDNGTYRNVVMVEGWSFYAGSSGKPSYTYSWWERDRCVNGSWVHESNDVFRAGGYIIDQVCRGNPSWWQVRRQCQGIYRSGSKVEYYWGSPEVNPKSCGQLTAEAAGLVWSNLSTAVKTSYENTAGGGSLATADGDFFLDATQAGLTNWFLQTLFSNAIPSVVGIGDQYGSVTSVGVSSNGVPSFTSYTNTIAGAGLGDGTGQGTGRVSNVMASGTYNIGNLADIAAAVAEGVKNGTGNTNGSSTETAQTYTNSGTYSYSTGFVGRVTSLVQTTRFSATLQGAEPLINAGTVSTFNVGTVTFGVGGNQQASGLNIDLSGSLGTGVYVFRCCLLIGEIVGFWFATMRLIRQGVA